MYAAKFEKPRDASSRTESNAGTHLVLVYRTSLIATAPATGGASHYASASLARARQKRMQQEQELRQAVTELERYLKAPLEFVDGDVDLDVVRWWGVSPVA